METRSVRKRRLNENETTANRSLEQAAPSNEKDDLSRDSAGTKGKNDPISPFENLPREMIWMIFEYVPEAVLQLRETCRVVKSQVDDFALQRPSFAHVETLEIRIKQEATSFVLRVDEKNNKLFELRHELIDAGPHSFVRRQKTHCQIYDFIWTPTANNKVMDESIIRFLRGFIGRRIAKYVIIRCNYSEYTQNVTNILEGVQFRCFKVFVRTLTDQMVQHFLEPIDVQKVDQLLVMADRFVMTSDPIKLLCKLSTRVRSLSIRESSIVGIERSRNYLFGVYDADWGQIILEMFAAKLDKLEIWTDYRMFFQQSGANLLIERLPTLGKQIWLEASFDGLRLARSLEKNHFVGAVLRNNELKLEIKHSARDQEPFFDY